MKKKVDNEIYEEIGKRLKETRERLGFSQLHISNTFSIGYQSLRRYEEGKTPIPIHLIYELADYYDINPVELLPASDVKKEFDKFDKDVLLEKIYFSFVKFTKPKTKRR